MKNEHGGDIYEYEGIIDFSSNINPLGMAESVKRAIIEGAEEACIYPDMMCRELRNDLSKKENINKDFIVCGNGAAELIYNFMAVLKPKKVMTAIPTFSEYEKAAKSIGAEMIYYEMREEYGFKIQNDILEKIDGGFDVMIICNPNNPTGIITEMGLMKKIIEKCREYKAFLIIDECFMDFAQKRESCAELIEKYENIAVIKAFTKMYAIPGIRLGYGICSDMNIIDGIYEIRQPWNVSVIAQKCGIAAMKEDIEEKTREYIKEEREYLEKELERLGIEYFRSEVNYILFKWKKGLKERLTKKNIFIRDCGNYRGLKDGYYRIAVKRHDENMLLIKAFKEEKMQWER